MFFSGIKIQVKFLLHDYFDKTSTSELEKQDWMSRLQHKK